MECYTTHLEGQGFIISVQHFITPALDFMPCFQARGVRDCKKGITSFDLIDLL